MMLHRHFANVFCLFIVASPVATAVAADPEPKTRLTARDSKFLLDDRPVFLLGCSYYAALGGDEKTWRADLDDMQKAGINWIRVWATWAAFGRDVSAVDEQTGQSRQPYMDKLKSLVAECDRRGMVVDVTLSRGNGVTGADRLATIESHQRAVESLIASLKPWRNWYLDLSNERNIQDKRFTSFDDLARLRARVRELDPNRLVTASHGGDLSDDEVQKYVRKVGVDFLAPHRPRDKNSPGHTDATTRRLLAKMKELGRVVPIHYQEPFRRGYGGFSPDVKDFVTDLRGAVSGGAAGWCFHNGSTRDAGDGHPRRSFDLSTRRLFDQLDKVEKIAIDAFKDTLVAAQRKSEIPDKP
jgi:hypothetical protein